MAWQALILNNGRKYDDASCGFADKKLWCWIKNDTVSGVFAVFSNPDYISEIHYIHGESETIYYGFSELDVIQKREYEPNKFIIDVRLTGDNISSEERPYPPVNQNSEVTSTSD